MGITQEILSGLSDNALKDLIALAYQEVKSRVEKKLMDELKATLGDHLPKDMPIAQVEQVTLHTRPGTRDTYNYTSQGVLVEMLDGRSIRLDLPHLAVEAYDLSDAEVDQCNTPLFHDNFVTFNLSVNEVHHY